MNENENDCGNCDWHIVKSQNERLCLLDGKVYLRGHKCKHWRTFNYHNRVDKQRQAEDYMRRVQDKDIAEKRLEAEKEGREEERKFQRLMAIVDRILAFFEGLIARLLRPGGGS